MNEQRTAVLTDSSCDVAPEFLQKYPEIHVLPMHIMYPEKDYLDGVDIDPLMTYRRFPAEFPNTSTPNIGEVQEMIEKIRGEGYNKIIAISISSGLSGTYNAIRLGAEDIEDMVENGKITATCNFCGQVYSFDKGELLKH
jgi:DegV family protein with EDD domain